MNINDGKYTGDLTKAQVIEQFNFRAGIHLSYIDKLEAGDRNYLLGLPDIKTAIAFHDWAVNGYRWAIAYLGGAKEPVQTKPFWQSKTIWINLLMAAGILLNATIGENLLNAETQAAVVVVVNLVLRLVTGKPLSK